MMSMMMSIMMACLGVPFMAMLLLAAARGLLTLAFARRYAVHSGAEGGAVLITGTSSGIGHAATLHLFRQGYNPHGQAPKEKKKGTRNKHTKK
mmetsp:Transcript_4544/g.9113  ORF Transcript_4544/g.9113 Transcript_4544/m.9113 type:complete len:93 (+) Transcript_4544:57-335(+)